MAQAQKNVDGVAFNVVMLADTNGNPVDPGGAAGPDRELVVTTYVAINAFTGASIGDTITLTQVIDVSGTPSTVAVIWRNQTTAADLASAPLPANIDLAGGDALTNAQLRASPVGVTYPVTRTVTPVKTTNGGTFYILAGAESYSVLNVGNGIGTFNGAQLNPGESDLGPPIAGATYPVLEGDATGTTFRVQRIA